VYSGYLSPNASSSADESLEDLCRCSNLPSLSNGVLVNNELDMEGVGKDSRDGEPLRSRVVASHKPFQAGPERSFTRLVPARRFTLNGSKKGKKF
jgi:hypothetical protein